MPKGKKAMLLRQDYLLKSPEFRDHFGKPTDGGLYAVSPFNVDINDKIFVKIGMSINMLSRAESYHTYYPHMFNYIALLRPNYNKGRKYKNRLNFLYHLERELIDILKDNKEVIRYKSPAKVSVETSEWFYCSVKDIHDAFTVLDEKYVDDKNRSGTFLFDYTFEDGLKDDEQAKKGKELFQALKLIKIK